MIRKVQKNSFDPEELGDKRPCLPSMATKSHGGGETAQLVGKCQEFVYFISFKRQESEEDGISVIIETKMLIESVIRH